jgi:hypothetical protein
MKGVDVSKEISVQTPRIHFNALREHVRKSGAMWVCWGVNAIKNKGVKGTWSVVRMGSVQAQIVLKVKKDVSVRQIVHVIQDLLVLINNVVPHLIVFLGPMAVFVVKI